MREAPRILLGENPLKHTTADAESTPQQINDNAQHAYNIQDKRKGPQVRVQRVHRTWICCSEVTNCT